MRITNLSESNSIYTSNTYFIRGEYNALDDKNTLIDVGRDPEIIKRLNLISGGVGKKKIDQVILTHSHFDHAGFLLDLIKLHSPVVYANSPYLEGVDIVLKGGELIKIGDKMFQVIHVPIHSNDSICLFCEEVGVLFSGDTPIVANLEDDECRESLSKIVGPDFCKHILKIFPGHGKPFDAACKETIENSAKK